MFLPALCTVEHKKNIYRNSVPICEDRFYVTATSTDYMSVKLNYVLGVWTIHCTGEKID